MSRTKIVGTYGPACESERTIVSMLRAGLDVFRLNLSHLEPAKLSETAGRIRHIAEAEGLPVAILADMPGPKIRCTGCEPEKFQVHDGERIELAPGKTQTSTPRRVYIQYPHLIEDVKKDHEIAINDGLVLLRVRRVDAKNGVLKCMVMRGGEISSRKGVCFLHSEIRIQGLTRRDREGLQAATQSPVDFVALSFVRSPDDIRKARNILKKAGNGKIPIVAKIEQREAIANLEEILEVTDGVMVARGDMGIEQPLENVPLLQKDIIRRCNETGRFVITATQMLESMIEHARPTRAEVTDVANAILDGSDAVMLSAETAMGERPVSVVRMMTRIAVIAETRIDPADVLHRLPTLPEPANPEVPDLDDALAQAACELALHARIDALVLLSFYGSTARRIARYRPACPIYVLSPYRDQCRRLAITWGVEVFDFPEAKPDGKGATVSPESLIEPAIEALRREGRLGKKQRVAFLAGVPLDAPGATNWLHVVEI
ncbi:pyruvate kinase [bacterium]|nr:pyruvate kinase [bacterium]